MAFPPAPSVASTKETTNYARLCRLLVDVGCQALRDTLDRIHPPAGLHLVLAPGTPAHGTLQLLRKKRILNPTQWGKLYPAIPTSVSSASFDITLLMVLLRNICHLTPPRISGWDKLPSATDTSTEANIARVKFYRNTVYGHASQASVDDATFNRQWLDISQALVALGGASYRAAINKLKNECMDPDSEERYRELLKEWKRNEDSIKEKLEEMEEVLKQVKKETGNIKDKLGQVEGFHKEVLKQVKEEKGNVKDKLGQVEENLKETLEQMGHEVENVSEKLDFFMQSSQDEDKLQMKSEIANISDKLDTLLTQRETEDEDKTKYDFEEIKKEIRTISEKLKSHITSREEENLKETVEQMGHELKKVSEKLDSLWQSSQDEDTSRNELQRMKSEIANMSEKLDRGKRKRQRETEDEEKMRDDVKEIKREIRIISDKLKSQMTSAEEESNRDNLEQLRKEIADIKEKLETLRNRLPLEEKTLRMEDDFDPAEIIDRICQLYKVREGWLAPFPWCEEFHFHLDSIFTRLKVISRKKTRGTATDNIVNMSGIFKPHKECQQPRTVLIEGKPGMGKTTYCNKMVYDWATGKQEAEDCFPRFETVLLLKCRDMKSDLWEAIEDQLLPRDVEEDVRKRFFNFVCKNQSNVLLVLDGLDEVPTSKLPVFTEIIQGRRELPKCRVVATARHEAGIKLRKHCDTLLQIEGFTKNDAREFIFKYFNDNKNLAEKLLSKLESDENLSDMSANPLNTALLCLICEEFQGDFPEGRTQLYEEIIQCILKRYRKKKGFPETNQDLVKVYEAQLKYLGQIALNGLLEGNLDLEESELKSHADELPEFGFLSVRSGSSKLRSHRHYSFLHKSFQECFAAFYLCCQLLNKEISVDVLGADSRCFEELEGVLSFTCGMVAARCKETVEALIKSLTVQVNDEECFYTLLGCISECRVDDSNFHLKMARVSGSLLKLPILDFSLGLSEVEFYVLVEALKVNPTLTKLDLNSCAIIAQGATGLAEALKVNSTLTVLRLEYNDIGDQGASGVAEALKVNSTLTNLDLEDNGIGDQGAASLAEALKVNSTLENLDLQKNGIGDQGATGLAEALKVNSRLTVLYLDQNGIDDQGATGLAEALKVNSTLTVLVLEDNGIGDQGATGLAEALKVNSTLIVLRLEYNDIGDQGASALAEALKVNSTLTNLDLEDNGIGDQGAAGLAEALKVNSTLENLDLQKNGIGDQGATGLAEALKVNSTLENLDLQKNGIGDQGATGLAEALKVNSTLTNLNLQNNGIGDQGATSLVEALEINSTLGLLDLRLNNVGKMVVSELRRLEHDGRIIKLYGQSYQCFGPYSDSDSDL